MTDYWRSIRKRLHEESGLHYPLNPVGQMLEIFFNEILTQFRNDKKTFMDQGFLITSEGLYLDIRGNELGLPRKEGKYAEGRVEFTLIHEIPQTSTPEKLKNETIGGEVFDFRLEDLQTILDRINNARKNDTNITTIYEARSATADFTIPKGMSIFSDTGFEYELMEDVKFLKGSQIASGLVRAKESGDRFNTEIDSLTIFNASEVNKDLIVTNTELIQGGVDGESDAEYKQRLLNNTSTNITLNYLKRMGIIFYSKNSLNEDVRTKLTSFNPYVSHYYAAIPPSNGVHDYVKYELITEDCFVIYIKGWKG